jgi:hypothetical protein
MALCFDRFQAQALVCLHIAEHTSGLRALLGEITAVSKFLGCGAFSMFLIEVGPQARPVRNVDQSKEMEDDENRFEKESRAFYERVLAAYMAIAQRAPQRVATVEAADPIAKVQIKIAGIVKERLLV